MSRRETKASEGQKEKETPRKGRKGYEIGFKIEEERRACEKKIGVLEETTMDLRSGNKPDLKESSDVPR